MRVTRKIRLKLVTETVEADVALRLTWKKFGLSANDGIGPNLSSTTLGEPVFLNLSMEANFDKQEASPAQVQAAEAKTIKCRNCDGPHLTVKCPYKDKFVDGASKFKFVNTDSDTTNSANASANSPNITTASAAPAGPTKYVPKFKRGGEDSNGSAANSSNSTETSSQVDDRDQGLAIRITNLSEIVVEADIRELVGAIGVPIARCNVGRDRFTGRCKGYAFVNFYSKEDAETVMRRLNGFPYGNLILKVEIARPVDK